MSELLIKQNNYRGNSILIFTISLVVSVLYFYIPPPEFFFIAIPYIVFLYKQIRSFKEVEIYPNYVIIRNPLTNKTNKVSNKRVFISNVYNGMYSIEKSYGFVVSYKKTTKVIIRFSLKNKEEEKIWKKKLLNSGYGLNNNYT
jgi:hypothetical protein